MTRKCDISIGDSVEFEGFAGFYDILQGRIYPRDCFTVIRWNSKGLSEWFVKKNERKKVVLRRMILTEKLTIKWFK